MNAIPVSQPENGVIDNAGTAPSNDANSSLQEVSREEIWASMPSVDRAIISSLINEFWDEKARRTIGIEIRVGNKVYRKPWVKDEAESATGKRG